LNAKINITEINNCGIYAAEKNKKIELLLAAVFMPQRKKQQKKALAENN